VEKRRVGGATCYNKLHALCVLEKWGYTPGSVGPNFNQVLTVCGAEISRKTIHYYCSVHTGRPFDTICSYLNSVDICTHHLDTFVYLLYTGSSYDGSNNIHALTLTRV